MKQIANSIFQPVDVELKRGKNNFELLRLLAAFAVIIAHSSYLLGRGEFPFDPFRFFFNVEIGKFGVFVFFIISGFLISHSWTNKKSILQFIFSRIARIYPAAIIVILLSVFVFGAVFSPLTFQDFITDQQTLNYLQNTSLFRMYYYLPGVFEQNFNSSINGSLWTLPYELTAYMALFIFGILKFYKKPIVSLLIHIGLVISYYFYKDLINDLVIPIIGIDFKTFIPLFVFFISGISYYTFRKWIPLTFGGVIIVTLLIILLRDTTMGFLVNSLLLPYCILYFAFSKFVPFKKLYRFGDFSYGLYLYAFPIQQVIVFFLPQISISIMILLSVICTFPMAMFSWFVIEKPALTLKKRLFG